MKKILLTGGSGFIARHFHEELQQTEIVNFDLVKPAHSLHSTHIQGDIRNISDLEKAFKNHSYDLILHLAAAHQDFGISKEVYFDTNEIGAKNLVQLAEKYGQKKIVFYSSVAVYGDSALPTTEQTTPNPSNNYGASKLAAEKVFLNWSQKNPQNELLIIRPAVVYGEWNFANMYRLIKQVAKRHFFYFGDGQNIKSIAYVKNLVSATLFLIDKMESGTELINYSDSPQMTTRQIVTSIIESLPKPYEPITFPLSLGLILAKPFDWFAKITRKNLPISSLRIHKLNTSTQHLAPKILTLGFSPKHTNIEGIHKMTRWYLENQRV